MTLLDRVRKGLTKGERPLRFLVAGAANTAFGVAIFPLLAWSNAWLYENYMVTLVIAQATSLTFAFLTYRVALRGRATSLKQLGVFSSFYVVHYVANIIMLPILVEGVGIAPITAQLGFIAVLIVTSYFWHSHLTFPKKGHTK